MTGFVQIGDRRTALSALREDAARAATGFAAAGVADGDSVAIMMRNEPAFLTATLGARLAGAYSVPVNWHSAGAEARYILEDCAARVLVVHADLLPGLDGHIPDGVRVLAAETSPEVAAAYEVAPSLCAVPAGREEWDAWLAGHAPWDGPPRPSRGTMIYTSGTTGRPKGVRRAPLDEERRLAFVRVMAGAFGLAHGPKVAMTGPLYHSAPNSYAMLTLELDGDMVLMPRFDAETLLRLIETHRLTHMHMVPTMFVRLLQLPDAVKARYDVSSLICVIHGAAPCPPEVKRAMIEWWGPVIREYYGSTEGSIVTVSESADWLARPGTVGRPSTGVEVRIYGEDGRILPAGQAGEIYMNPTLTPSFTYNNLDDERRAIERDGFITNGDVGWLDEDGYLFVSDRKRDMIISGGVNVYPAEIEAALFRHPAVRDCAVFGIPDDEYGETVAAALELRDGFVLDEAELRAFLAGHLAAFKLPRLFAVHDRLPREDSGKIFKRKLRQPYWEKAGREI